MRVSSGNVFGDHYSPVTKLPADEEAMVLVLNKLAKEGRQIPKMTYYPLTIYFCSSFITNIY